MNDITIELRKFGDGTWSVMARVFNPSKKFYEHPTFINLTKKDAEQHCQTIIQQNPSIQEIERTWVFIGD